MKESIAEITQKVEIMALTLPLFKDDPKMLAIMCRSIVNAQQMIANLREAERLTRNL